MGITALFVIVLITLLFLVSYIPKLTLRKKIFIVIVSLLVCFAVLAFLLVKKFDGGKAPLQENDSLEMKGKPLNFYKL